MRTYRRHLAVAGLTAIALVSAACGSSGGSGSSETTAGATTSAAAAESSTTAAAAGGSSTTAAAAASSSSSAAPAAGAEQVGAKAVADAEAAAKAKPLKATGDPVVIGFQNPEGDPNGSFPEYTLAAQAAVKYINEELGGIGGDITKGKAGRPIELAVCKMAIAPAESLRCANEIAAKKPFAVISSLNFFGNHFDIYKQANIPVLVGTPITPLDFTSPGVYAVGGGGGCLGVHTGLIDFMTKELKITKVAVPWANTPPGVFCYHDLEKKPLEVLAGKKLDGTDRKADGNPAKGTIPNLTHNGVPVLPGQADLAPQATQVLDFKPDGIIFSGQGADCWTLVSALSKLGWSAAKTPLVLSGACIDLAKMKELGDITKGIYFIGDVNVLDPSTLTGQIQSEATTYLAKMKQYAEGGTETATKGFATQGFGTIMKMWQIAQEQAGGDPTKLDSAAFSKAMASTKDHHAYMGTGMSCADGASNAPYIAACATLVTATQWDGTKLVPKKSNFSGLYLLKGTDLDFGK